MPGEFILLKTAAILRVLFLKLNTTNPILFLTAAASAAIDPLTTSSPVLGVALLFCYDWGFESILGCKS